MKHLLLVCCLICTPALAQSSLPDLSGLWYTPNMVGPGCSTASQLGLDVPRDVAAGNGVYPIDITTKNGNAVGVVINLTAELALALWRTRAACMADLAKSTIIADPDN
jgi:hypothetical protein